MATYEIPEIRAELDAAVAELKYRLTRSVEHGVQAVEEAIEQLQQDGAGE